MNEDNGLEHVDADDDSLLCGTLAAEADAQHVNGNGKKHGTNNPRFSDGRKPDHDIIEAVDDPHRLARICLAELPVIRFWRNEFFIFDRPAFRVLADDEVRAKLTAIVKREFDLANIEAQQKHVPSEDGPPPKVHKVTRNLLSNVMEVLKSKSIVPFTKDMPIWMKARYSFPADQCIVMTNGILWPESLMKGRPKLIPPTPALFTTTAVDFGYDAAAECPLWLQFLCELWADDPDAITTLQEIFGYVLLPDTSLQKIFMLIGPKRSGKGTIARVMRGLVGASNVAAPTLGSLQGEFGLQPLLNKTLAIIGDARLSGRSDESQIVERLLSVSGEDAQTVNRKHIPAVTTILRTRFLLLSNELPKLRDASATLPSRMILLRLTKSFYGNEDHKLTDKLMQERPGVLRWALEGWMRLKARGYIVQPQSGGEMVQDLEELASPVLSFVRDNCELGAGFQVPIRNLFDAWKTWCQSKGRHEGTEQTFGRDLKAAAPAVCLSRPRVEGERVRVYEGLRLSGY